MWRSAECRTVLLDFEPDAEGKLHAGRRVRTGATRSYGANAFGDENMELTFINWDKETNAPADRDGKAARSQFGGDLHLPTITDENLLIPPAYVARQRRLQHCSPGTPPI